MVKVKAYIRKNPVFVSLLSVILFISIGLGVYYMVNIRVNDPEEVEAPQNHKTESTKAEISSFEGTFNSAKEVVLNWAIVKNKDNIVSTNLYHGETFIAEVTNLNSYTLPQNVYQFPGGENEFRLSLTTENNDEISKKTTVNIDSLSNTKFTTEKTDTGLILKLEYKYEEGQNISIPSIAVFGATNEYNFVYRDTQKESDGSFVYATTTYDMMFSKPKVSESVKIRWFFESLNMNYDFSLNIEGLTNAKDSTIEES